MKAGVYTISKVYIYRSVDNDYQQMLMMKTIWNDFKNTIILYIVWLVRDKFVLMKK